MGRLNGKVAIVTGSSSGIGEELAYQLGKEGAIVVVTARRKERLEALGKKINSEGGKAIVVPADLTRQDQITNLVRKTLNEFGRIDILANVAGWGRFKWYDELSAQELRIQFEVGVMGLAELTRQVVGVMKKQRSGHIINMASYASRFVFPPLTVYATTKYAVEGLSDGLRRELSPWGIKVTRVHPGGVRGTEFNLKAAENGGIKYGTAASPLLRVSKEYVARKIVEATLNPPREIFIGRIYDFAVFANRHLTGIVDMVAGWWVRKLERER